MLQGSKQRQAKHSGAPGLRALPTVLQVRLGCNCLWGFDAVQLDCPVLSGKIALAWQTSCSASTLMLV